MDLGPARCALHADASAELACLRCGAFACSACAPIPSILCAECAARLGSSATGWADVPPAPGKLRRLVAFPTATLYAAVAFAVVLRALSPHSLAVALVVLLLAGGALVLALGRLATLLRARRGRMALRGALTSMREQRYADASVRLEETLRALPLDAGARALALYLFGANLASAGHFDRALAVLEPLVPSGWRDLGTTRLLRGQGWVVLAVVRALAGDLPGARADRARATFGPVARLTYTPAYGDAVIAARSGEHRSALELSLAAQRFARRWSLTGVARSAALLEAFARERLGQGDAAVEIALAPARAAPPGAHDGMAAAWPEMRDFLGRRLPAEIPASAGLFADRRTDHL